MDEDTQDHNHELEELIQRLIEQSMGIAGTGIPPGCGFRIIIASGEIPNRIPPYPHQASNLTVQPIAEVHTHNGEVIVVAEIPGVEEGQLHLRVTGTTLRIMAQGHECRYDAEVKVPPVELDTMSHHLKNGVLEVRFRTSRKDEMNEEDHQTP